MERVFEEDWEKARGGGKREDEVEAIKTGLMGDGVNEEVGLLGGLFTGKLGRGRAVERRMLSRLAGRKKKAVKVSIGCSYTKVRMVVDGDREVVAAVKYWNNDKLGIPDVDTLVYEC